MKGAWPLRHAVGKTDIKYLRNVFYMTGWQPVQVNFWLRTMHKPSVVRHQPQVKLYFLVWANDPSSQPILLCHPSNLHRRTNASSDIQDHSVPGWNIIDLDFATFTTSQYQQNRSMSTLRAP